MQYESMNNNVEDLMTLRQLKMSPVPGKAPQFIYVCWKLQASSWLKVNMDVAVVEGRGGRFSVPLLVLWLVVSLFLCRICRLLMYRFLRLYMLLSWLRIRIGIQFGLSLILPMLLHYYKKRSYTTAMNYI